MTRIPRVTEKPYYLLFSAVALFMGISAGKNILPASYDNVPMVILPFLFAFIGVWFGFVIYMFLFGLSALQTLEMDRDEIRVRMGPVVIRRIPTDRIKTVGLNVMFNRANTEPSVFLLALSSRTPEELNEKGLRKLQKPQIKKRMLRAGVIPEGKYAGAKACLFERFPGLMLWVEDSEEARRLLKKNLTTTVFLI